MEQDQHDMLIQLNTNMIAVLKAIETLNNRDKWITTIAIKQSKLEERVDTHYKIIWGAIGSSLTACLGLICLFVKEMMPFSPK